MQVKYVDHIAIALIACLASGIAWFWMSALPQCRPANGSVADWLQAIGTVVAAIIAVSAFVLWRRPDDARRRADTGELILRQSQSLETAALAARHGTLTVLFEEPEITLSDKMESAAELAEQPMLAKIEALEEEMRTLRTYRAEAGMLYQDRPVVDRMDTVEATCRAILDAHVMIGTMDEQRRRLVGDKRFEAALDKLLAALGARLLVDYELGEPEETDAFQLSLQSQCDALRQDLVSYLVGR